MKAIILAGGLGTRLREETEFRPKPMVEVGGRPILWHIMKHLSRHGIKDFIIATGYKSAMIKEYFLNYDAWNSDLTVNLGDRGTLKYHGNHDESDWTVTIAYTGENSMTGARVLQAATYVDDERFLVAYGDGIADVDIHGLLKAHKDSGVLATVTTVQPTSRFGILDIDADGMVRSFREKPTVEDWISIGFFVMEPGALSYLGEDSVLEERPLAQLASEGQLAAYRHQGFWQPMDTYRELQLLQALWDSGEPPWITH